MPKVNEYTERSVMTITDTFQCFNENGDVINVPYSVLDTYLKTILAQLGAANTFTDANDFTSGSITVPTPTASADAATMAYVLAQVAEAVGLSPAGDNTWTGENQFDDLVTLAGSILMAGGATLANVMQVDGGAISFEDNGGETVDVERDANGMKISASDASAFLTITANMLWSNMPTSDPSVEGQPWADSSDGYTVKISQG